MLANRSTLSRFALPQTSAEWEPVFARGAALFAKVPLGTWQFFVRLLLVFILSLSLSRLFWLLFPAPVVPAAAVAIVAATGPVDAVDNAAVNIGQLKSLSIFGKVVEAPKQEQPAVIESAAVDTRLNLVLVGVVESSLEIFSRAIISSGDKQDVYAINAPLPVGNNVVLSKVMNDRVIINNNGQYESLWLYQNDPNAPPVSRPTQSVQPVAAVQNTQPSTAAYGPERPPAHEEAAAADPVLAQASRNLADVISMSIYRENGQILGYKIRPGRDAEKFKAVGLQADDLVLSINGMPLSNPAKIMEIYKNMGNTTSASLEIRRAGSLITVDVVVQ